MSDPDFDRFLDLFKAKGHVTNITESPDTGYDEDGVPSYHPMVMCERCYDAVCWMCVMYRPHIHSISECTKEE